MHLLQFKWLSTTFLASAILLQGCGWHLRGAEPLPEQLQSLHLQTTSKNSAFVRSLRRSLKAIDVTLTDTASDAAYTLKVSGIHNKRRTLSTTGTAKVAEYALTSALTYSVRNQEGTQLTPPTVISTEKIYLFNRNNATSAFEEESLLRQEMRRELIQQLIRRYRAIKPITLPITATDAE